MSFGFSIGDFLAAAQLAHKIRKDFSGAPSQFKSLSDETKLLSMVLQDVDVKVDESDLTAQQEANLEQAMSTCEAVLHDLQAICDMFSDLGTAQGQSRKSVRRVWKKLKWEPDGARELRERISSSIAMLTTLLNQLSSGTTVAVKKGVDRLNQGQDRQERLAILNWLSSFDYTAQQNDILTRRETGTGRWLLESPKFMSWKSTKGQTLFCPGIPGAGKTILSSIVVETLTAEFQSDPSVCVAHIYFNYQEQENQTVHQVFTNLLRQLVAGQSNIPATVDSLYKQHLKKGSKLTFEEVCGLFCSFSSLYSRVFLVVDALDECPSRCGRRNTVLAELMMLQSTLSANIMCTTRPIPEIEAWFCKAMSIKVQASEHDVRKYLDGQLGRLPGFVARNPELQERVKKQIVEVAGGMFLLAHLHLESLMYKPTRKALCTALEGLPRGSSAYDDTYEKTMKRLQTQVPDQAEFAKNILQWIVCAKTPLKVSQLQHALAVEIGEEHLDLDNIPDADDMVTACGGLVTIKRASGIVRLVHYTTQEYLERTRDIWFPTAEDQMAEVCLTYLSFVQFRTHLWEANYNYWERPEDWPFYSYAGRHWGTHARQTPPWRVLAFLQLKHAFQLSLLISWEHPPFLPGNYYSDSSDLSKINSQTTSELHMAAYFGLTSVVHELAVSNTVDQQNANGWTPLAFAVHQEHVDVIQLLSVNHKANPNTQDDEGMSPLHHAAFYGYTSSAKLLLEVAKAAPHLRDKKGQTPLYLAIYNGHVEVVRLLLENLEGYEDFRSYRNSALCIAAAKGYKELVELILSQPDIDPDFSDTLLRGYPDRTPLSWAATRGDGAILGTLLQAGRANVNMTNSGGRTPLSFAAEHNSITIVDTLLRMSNVDVDSRDSKGLSPLFFAAVGGHEEIMQKLLSTNRVDPNIMAKKGRHTGDTLLSYATSRGLVGMVKMLLETDKVDANLRDGRGETPFSIATGSGNIEISMAILLAQNIDVDSKNMRGRTPLSSVAGRGDINTVNVLIKTHGADINSKDHRGRTVLSYAAENGHVEVVRALLQTRSVDIDAKDECGRTPLFHAAWGGHTRVFEMLLQTQKVDFDLRDLRRRTPLSYAAWGGHLEVVEALLQTGKVDIDSRSLDSVGFWTGSELHAGAGRTPLSFAAGRGHHHVVRRLLDTGQVDPDSEAGKHSLGQRPLSWAIAGASAARPDWGSDDVDFEAVVDLLLKTGKVNVNAKATANFHDMDFESPYKYGPEQDQTPLLVATKSKVCLGIVKLLLENGADVNARSKDDTPLSNAMKYVGGGELVNLLLEYGATPLGERMGIEGDVCFDARDSTASVIHRNTTPCAVEVFRARGCETV